MTDTLASNTSTGHRRVVVGVDDSPGGRAAFAFAAREAEMRGAELHAVCAWSMPGGHTAHATVPGPLRDACLDEERETQERLAGEVLVDTPDLSCVLAVGEPPAARALVEASKGADLVVVGSRGRGSLAGLLLGSVSEQVVHHAHCPVVVVGPRGAADVEHHNRRHEEHR
ncbi:MAG: universal stress protein [Acidimicrobiales bacterium]|nr:universal stress protein [Acidimicrobiales bacterium]